MNDPSGWIHDARAGMIRGLSIVLLACAGGLVVGMVAPQPLWTPPAATNDRSVMALVVVVLALWGTRWLVRPRMTRSLLLEVVGFAPYLFALFWIGGRLWRSHGPFFADRNSVMLFDGLFSPALAGLLAAGAWVVANRGLVLGVRSVRILSGFLIIRALAGPLTEGAGFASDERWRLFVWGVAGTLGLLMTFDGQPSHRRWIGRLVIGCALASAVLYVRDALTDPWWDTRWVTVLIGSCYYVAWLVMQAMAIGLLWRGVSPSPTPAPLPSTIDRTP